MNTYPVRTEHALLFRVLTARAAGSLAFCTARASLHTCIGSETLIAQRVWRAVKAQKKIFRGQGASASYLERHELLCLYSLLDVANHTGGV